MSKLIFFFCISWFIGVHTMGKWRGTNFPTPGPPCRGVFGPGGPKTDNIISYANNEPIFVIVVPILGFLNTTNPLMTFSN